MDFNVFIQHLFIFISLMLHLGDVLKKTAQKGSDDISEKKPKFDLPKAFLSSIIDKQKKRLEKKYLFPATKKNALIHQNAIKFGSNPDLIKKQEVCPCCMQNIHTKKLSLC